MASDNLRKKTKLGLVWSSIGRFSKQGVQFGFSILLARILSPNDYGLLAMPSIFYAIAWTFIDSGFGGALIRKPDLKEEDLSTAFYFNIFVGVFFYITLFLLSPVIANFYNTPELETILKFTALSTLLYPQTTVHYALMNIRLDFKTPAKLGLVSAITGGVTGLILAYMNYGVWALIYSQIITALLDVVLVWWISSWRPKTGWSWESYKYLWGYGSKMLASGLLECLYGNIYPVVIGKFYNASQLGLYNRAKHFSDFPSSNLTGILHGVTFPVLGSIQNDDARLQSVYRRMIRVSAFVIFPLMLGLAAVADPLVKTLLTDKWLECIILLQLMCFSMMWYPIHSLNLNLLQVKGRSDLFFRLEVIKKIVGVVILAATIFQGLVAMCVGSIISSLICLVINTYYTGKLINVGFFRQIKDLIPTILLSSCMYGVVLCAVWVIPGSAFQLVGGICVGLIFYVGTAHVLKMVEIKEMIMTLKK